ncbi:dihydrofolate reductase-like domain-containing protein [Lactifluus subvellereus]|nr:dihydrofolate reductase-like domain-containing protein [Lactifluus subvellereus]
MSRVTLIVAATMNNGIGQGGKLPWRLPKEMQYFARVTTGRGGARDGEGEKNKKNAVVMGRATWESIPPRFRPLAGRINVVVSQQVGYNLCGNGGGESASDVPALASSLDAGLERVHAADANRVFVIGGAKLYAAALPLAERVLLTRIMEPSFEGCDVFMPNFIDGGEWTRAPHDALNDWVEFEVPKGVQEEGGVKYEFEMWMRHSAQADSD